MHDGIIALDRFPEIVRDAHMHVLSLCLGCGYALPTSIATIATSLSNVNTSKIAPTSSVGVGGNVSCCSTFGFLLLASATVNLHLQRLLFAGRPI